MQKARHQPFLQRRHRPLTACRLLGSGSISLPSRGSFHLSLAVLFTIGHRQVFSLRGWSLQIQTGFHVSGPTQEPTPLFLSFAYRTFTFYGPPFQVVLLEILKCLEQALQPRKINSFGLGFSPFARRYRGNHFCFLFLYLLRCFTSVGLALHTL